MAELAPFKCACVLAGALVLVLVSVSYCWLGAGLLAGWCVLRLVRVVVRLVGQ